MNNKTGILLRNMLKSTSGWNILRYSKDKKKRRQIIGSYVAFTILFLVLMLIAGLNAFGMGAIGAAEAIPELTVLVISLIAFFFTLLRSNGYLFGFKEYDMLMAMPFEVHTIVACKFLYMYIKNLVWYVPISLATLAGYVVFAEASALKVIAWLIMTFVIPIIPSVIASAIGTIIVRIGVSFKHKKAIQMVLTMAFILVCIFSRFIVEAIFKNGEEEQIIQDISELTKDISGYYFPAKWFANAINDGNIWQGLGFVILTVAIFILFFAAISKSYRKINSRLSASASRKDYKMTIQRSRNLVWTIVYKEWKRMTGSTTYATNVLVGAVVAVLLGIVGLFVSAETIVGVITSGAPLEPKIVLPAVPVFVYFFIGMVPTTCCSLSLEGKNYWIVQSMPIKKLDLYKGKMLFNMCLMLPCMLIGVIGLGVSFRADWIEMLLFVLYGIATCAFSTCFGMVTGIKHAKFEWENEVEVIKQGAAVTIYLLPNMFVSMALLVASVFLSFVIGAKLVLLIMAICYGALAGLFYGVVKKIAKRG